MAELLPYLKDFQDGLTVIVFALGFFGSWYALALFQIARTLVKIEANGRR
jgi:hypothetical protein